jgi:1-acyl-sn-glycerol-3-phosphate acyltransferase
VLVSNHFHVVDCGYIAKIYNKDVYFLAKKELFKNKLFGKILKSYGAIPVDRENPDMQTMLTSLRVLKDGHKLVVFAEGTRNKSGTNEIQPLKGGAMVFAVKSKSPIVPIVISRKPKIFRKTHIIVGEPFELEQYYGAKMTEETVNELESVVYGKMVELQSSLFQMISKKKKGKKSNDCVQK